MKLIDLKNANASTVLETFDADAWRDRSAQVFAELGLPSKKSEVYQYADMEPILSQEMHYEQREIEDISISEKIIIKNGIVLGAPKDVKIDYQAESFRDDEHFDPLYHLGHVASKVIITIEPQNDSKLEIVHLYTLSNELIAYRIELQIKPNTSSSIYETFESLDTDGTLILYGYDVKIGKNASLKMIKNQTLSAGGYRMVASHSFSLSDNATLDLSTFDFGDASALQTINIKLAKRAEANLSHLLYAGGNARMGTVSKIVHEGEHSTSKQQAKNILNDSARGIFDALIKVEHTAKYTKANQNSKAILLESGAYMASRPQLEIYIDELEASHGSTTGQLDERELFYMRSRGISETEARRILIQAFANELIDTIDSDTISEAIRCSFDNAFYGHIQLECLESCHGCE